MEPLQCRNTTFLLSPANLSGKRAQLLFRDGATFALALRLQRGEAVPLSEVYAFVSGLYFRGKLAYAKHFSAAGDAGKERVLVITPDRGLVPAHTPVNSQDLLAMASVEIGVGNPIYMAPLSRDLILLAESLAGGTEYTVLLGSIATAKYVDPCVNALAEKLLFPAEFVGRGDLSRGGLCLRAVAAGEELRYESISSTSRKGKRPPRLAKL